MRCPAVTYLKKKIYIILMLAILVKAQLQEENLILEGIRLRGGKAFNEGNIEINIGGLWGFVCDDGFGFAEADVICRDLGFHGAAKYTKNNYYGLNTPEWRKSSVKFWLHHVNCTLQERDFRRCHSDIVGKHECSPVEIAGVSCWYEKMIPCGMNEYPCEDSVTCIQRDKVCDEKRDCPDGSDEYDVQCNDVGATKLVVSNIFQPNIPGSAIGSVLIKRDGEWGRVCDRTLYTGNEAKVICRSMGYEGGWSLGYPSSYLGQLEGRVAVTVPKCSGDEDWIGECPDVSWWSTRCRGEGEDYGVFCYDEGLKVRIRGKGRKRGRVEVKLSGIWGSVCDAGFDVLDAQVVCRMLGYHGDAVAYKRAGLCRGPLWHISLNCFGHENDLQECSLRFLNSSCPKGSSAGVICSHRSGQIDLDLDAALGNKECGILEDSSSQFITSLGKIRGGIRLSPFDTPWLAVFRHTVYKSSFCGGSIISEDFILTAAHCLEDILTSDIVIRVGDYNEDIEEPYEEEFHIDKYWIHEEKDEQAFGDHDIALIKIERKFGRGIRFSSWVKPICLPKSDINYDTLKNCSVVGVGPASVEENNSKYPRVGKQDIAADYFCEESVYGGPSNYTSSMVCSALIYPKFVNPCNGDSGGPLMCRMHNKHILAGIVSTGPACVSLPSFDLYVRVTKYLGWILKKVRTLREL